MPLWECWKDEDSLTATVKTVKKAKREKKAIISKSDVVGKENVAQEIVLHHLMLVGEEQRTLSIGVVERTLSRLNMGMGCEYGGYLLRSVREAFLQP